MFVKKNSADGIWRGWVSGLEPLLWILSPMKLGVLHVLVTQASRSAETGPSVGLSGFILSPGSGRDTVSKE